MQPASALLLLVVASCSGSGAVDGGASGRGGGADGGLAPVDGGGRFADGGQRPLVTFRKRVLDPLFRSEGVAVADVNRDGRKDILAGNLWYEAPDWTPHEVGEARAFAPDSAYSNSFLNFAWDVNGDGWPDLVVAGFPGQAVYWYENPRDTISRWAQHLIAPVAANESPRLIMMGGATALVTQTDASHMTLFTAEVDPSAPFVPRELDTPVALPNHGLGYGDIDGDGREDILTPRGFWRQPPDPLRQPWPFTPANLGPDCAQMYVVDVNADGLPDIITTSAHGKGVWWYEQSRDAVTGAAQFTQHLIDDSFSQSHALVVADINGDGLPDLVTGKRMWAHGPNGDVEPNAPRVLYWFEMIRDAAGVRFEKHLIDDDCGVGTQFVVEDVNGDGLPDVVVANKRGVFLFEQQASGR